MFSNLIYYCWLLAATRAAIEIRPIESDCTDHVHTKKIKKIIIDTTIGPENGLHSSRQVARHPFIHILSPYTAPSLNPSLKKRRTVTYTVLSQNPPLKKRRTCTAKCSCVTPWCPLRPPTEGSGVCSSSTSAKTCCFHVALVPTATITKKKAIWSSFNGLLHG